MSSQNTPQLPEGFLDRLADIVGADQVIFDHRDLGPYVNEHRGLYESVPGAVVRPASSQDVAAIIEICAAANIGVVPQGGNTGLVGGCVARGEIIINLERMNAVREIDAANFTMTVDAGLLLADAQAAATAAGCFFPLSLGAEGSCQIGGNISTNAGGTAVLRFGNMRDLVLGLEVVLPDGQIWNGLRALRKDNTGYDLKQLFIGAEGTLGIVTGAVLKLFPAMAAGETALVALENVANALDLFNRARAGTGDALTAFELIPRIGLDHVLAHIPGVTDPFAAPHDTYALIETRYPETSGDKASALENVLAEALEQGLIVDAVLAASQAQAADLWQIREALPEAQTKEGASIKNDVAVPVSKVPEFITRATAVVELACPGIRAVPFGHLGDGNIHFNLTQPRGADPASYLARWDELTSLVNDVVDEFDGSFSAEHGVGLIKRDTLAARRGEVELALMRALKSAIDPKGLMNPGKMLAEIRQGNKK